MDIEINHISREFPVVNRFGFKTPSRFLALNDVSFKIKSGECYGLLGNNGAGKTTLMRIMAGLIAPTSGSIVFKDEKGQALSALPREKIAFCTSEMKLDEYFTPHQTMAFFAELYGMSKEQGAEREKVLFERFDLTKAADKRIGGFSTGMKQKISLAVSLIHNPDLIIYDEPTNGLDLSASQVVIDFLRDASKEGKTILISSHIFDIIAKTCSKAGFLVDGRLVSEVPVKDAPGLEKAFFDALAKEGK
jgi:ABC-type multidrug transport system ATPase subunit